MPKRTALVLASSQSHRTVGKTDVSLCGRHLPRDQQGTDWVKQYEKGTGHRIGASICQIEQDQP